MPSRCGAHVWAALCIVAISAAAVAAQRPAGTSSSAAAQNGAAPKAAAPAAPKPASATAAAPEADGPAAAAGGFECGKPMGPCGASIPDGVTCAKGAGWCEPGSYCGWERDVPGSRCLLLPKDCGAVGAACCPSNADSPHTSEQDKRNRMPFCKNGNTCFFFVGRADKPAGDIYTGNTGSYSCVKVEEDCGTGPGKPCCPVPYMVATNPVVKRQGCPGVPNGYCDYARETNLSPAGPLQPPRGARRGVCTANAPGCGQLGKACCWDTSGANSLSGSGTCGGGAGQPRGYCRNPFAASGNPYDKARPASFSELVCTKCPDNLDRETALKTNSEMYFMCTRSDR